MPDIKGIDLEELGGQFLTWDLKFSAASLPQAF
jgi:hypothetical protein